jgi:hypothetical protein
MPERLGAAEAATTARLMWTLFEPVHNVSYFAPEPRATFEQAGLRGYWRGYFAGRSAPLGTVAAAPVVAAFFSFAPAADLDGTEALGLRVGVNLAADGARSRASFGWTREQLQPNRGWTDADWDAATGRLTERGLLGDGGAATSAGTALYQQAEDATDAAAARPWSQLTAARVAELAKLLRPVATACADALPFPAGVGTST